MSQNEWDTHIENVLEIERRLIEIPLREWGEQDIKLFMENLGLDYQLTGSMDWIVESSLRELKEEYGVDSYGHRKTI